jgi:hypothetical protein
MMAETFHFGEVTVEIADGLTVTRLPDGGIVPAEHREQPGQAELAQDLGYATAEEMNRQHDLLHSLLSHMLGLPASPTLQGVGNMRFCPYWREEENAVFAIAAYANVAGVDLTDVARRWSED